MTKMHEKIAVMSVELTDVDTYSVQLNSTMHELVFKN